jgi:hypothetical protein
LVLYISQELEFFLQLVDGLVFHFDPVLQHVDSKFMSKIYLSRDSVEISLALRFCKIDLYISICLYALESSFLVLSRYFGGWPDCDTENDLLGDLPRCLLIFLVS